MTARDYARYVEGRVPEAPARAFHEITETYLATRFGDNSAPADPIHLKTPRRELPRKLATQALSANG